MKKSLLLISFTLIAGLPGCRQPKVTTKSQSGSEVRRIEHPAPDQGKIDSLKEIRGKDKKPATI
ncbi:MAG: hypothetical protein M0Q38_02510 [Bacteroidales bacterium]|jgi:hypothetical protein|nr:hypothetical protein [Bacteroidales bacterium]